MSEYALTLKTVRWFKSEINADNYERKADFSILVIMAILPSLHVNYAKIRIERANMF